MYDTILETDSNQSKAWLKLPFQDAARVCKEFMERDPDEVRFTVIALVPKQEQKNLMHECQFMIEKTILLLAYWKGTKFLIYIKMFNAFMKRED